MTSTLQTLHTLELATTTADDSVDDLSLALTRVAMNPDHACHLHEILGGYCHQCRNLLNTLNISLYLAQKAVPAASPEVWQDVESHYREVEQFIERLQWICRPVPLRCVELSLKLFIEGRIPAWTEMLGKRGRNLIVEAPSEPSVGQYDPTRLELAFDDLVAWRSELGDPSTDLRIRWKAERGSFLVEWDEPRTRRTCGKTPSRDRTLNHSAKPNSLRSLAVPLLHRVMSLHGGSVSETNRNPLRIRLSWPLVAPRA